MYFPDLAQESQVDRGPHVRAVGWLDDKHPFARGPVPEPVRWRLARFAEQAGTSTEALNWGFFMGFHTCELCNRARDGSNFGVVAGPLVYVCPAMIAHYVEVHGYLPPEQFQLALLACPLPATPEYQALAAPLRYVPPEPLQSRTTHNIPDLRYPFSNPVTERMVWARPIGPWRVFAIIVLVLSAAKCAAKLFD